jgi:hypothetical protein
VLASRAEKTAAEFSARGLRKIEQLPGRLNFEVIPNLDNFQASHVIRLVPGLSPHVAAVVAQHAFQNGRSYT